MPSRKEPSTRKPAHANPGLQAVFVAEDTALFALEDADLKAKALRYDVIPRLELLLQRALTEIRTVYGCDPLEVSTVAPTPAFRTNRRKGDVEHHYGQCTAGITGLRSIVWNGADRIDDKPARVFPFRFDFVLDPNGISVVLNSWLLRSFTQRTNNQFHSQLLENLDVLVQIMQIGNISFGPSFSDILSFRGNLELLAQEPADNWWMSGRVLPVPLKAEDVDDLLLNYLLLWPLYDAMIRIATKQPLRFAEQIAALQTYLESQEHVREAETVNETTEPSIALDPGQLAELEMKAMRRVPVMAGLRWRVLQSAGWRCVGCGRNTTEHKVILHIDHIIPRSRGGKDELDNYQALCEQCNIGKSNLDDTDIRKLHSGS